MSLMTWDKKYSIEVAEIDKQHERLFMLFNKLHESMSAGKDKAILMKELSDLIDYTRVHFAAEEKLMKEFSYVGFVEHKRVHDDLIDEAISLKERYAKGEITLSTEVSRFLTSWLTEHILDMDRKYSALFKSRGY